MGRTYRLDRRAKGQAETRARIVAAAVELHQEKGVSATSMRDVAARAGVGAVTVYRHFHDDAELLGACSASYFEDHPLPDPEAWADIADPVERLRAALAQAYAYHRTTAPMMASVLPEVRDTEAVRPYDDHWATVADRLLEAWPQQRRQDPALRAALALALRFETWAFLTGPQGLSDAQAIEVMAGLVP